MASEAACDSGWNMPHIHGRFSSCISGRRKLAVKEGIACVCPRHEDGHSVSATRCPYPRRPPRRRISPSLSPSAASPSCLCSALPWAFPLALRLRAIGLPRRRWGPPRAPPRRHLVAWAATKAGRGCVNASHFSLSLLSLIYGPEFYFGWPLCNDP